MPERNEVAASEAGGGRAASLTVTAQRVQKIRERITLQTGDNMAQTLQWKQFDCLKDFFPFQLNGKGKRGSVGEGGCRGARLMFLGFFSAQWRPCESD